MFLRRRHRSQERNPILPPRDQVRAWRKASRKMKWGLSGEELGNIPYPPNLSEWDYKEGFAGIVLCYGFGSEESGESDPIRSGKLAWEYAQRRRKGRIWQCEYADFSRPEDIRLRPTAPGRPSGFYWIKFHFGQEFRRMTVNQFRKKLAPPVTGCGPEGFQLLCVTHPHIADLMNERKLAFMALADYDIAPHGFQDFYESPQLFCSQDTLGFGVGNVDGPYPLFGIPKICFPGAKS